MPNLTALCPAAELLSGPPTQGPSVVCRVMKLEAERVDRIVEGTLGGVLVTDRDNGSVLRGFCCGKGLPKVYEGQKPRGHFTYCPIWEAAEQVERERREADQRVFEAPEKPKILGEDPEVAADLLGVDPEQIVAEEKRAAEARRSFEKPPPDESLRPETLTGIEAMKEVATDPEWEESE